MAPRHFFACTTVHHKAQERLQRLQAQKKALEAKISREQARVRERERKARTRLLLAYGGLVDLAGLTQTDQGTVLGLLLEGAQRLQQDPATRKRWQMAGEAVLTSQAEERRVLNARKRGVVHVVGQGRNGTPGVQVPEEGERA